MYLKAAGTATLSSHRGSLSGTQQLNPANPRRIWVTRKHREATLRRFIVLVLFCLSATPVLAFDPYVDAVSGSDANNGAFSTPVKTIKKALTLVTANGTIRVRPGTYNSALGETFPITMPSGIKLQSTGGAAVTIIDATGANARVFLCSGNSNTTLIEGFTITGGFYQPPTDGSNATGGGIFMDNNDQTTIRRCILTGNEARGYNGNGGGFFSGGIAYGGAIGINNGVHSIVNCVFRNNIARGGNGFAPATFGYPGGDAHGGGIWDGAGTTTLINDTFNGNQAIGGNGANAISGTSMGGGGGTALYSSADIQNGTSTNTIFSNNVDTGGTGGSGFGGGANGGNGLATGTLSATAASYNLFFNNTGGDGFTGTNALTATDPLFVNPPANLHLRSSSPAKYAGNSASNPGVDLENNPRPFTPSIGAFELGLFPTVVGGIGRVTITWAGVSGASSYNLYYGAGGGTLTTGSSKITGATSPYVFYPVLNGTTWSFALTAVENGVEGPISPTYSTSSAPVSGGQGGPWGTAATSGNTWTNITTDKLNANTLYATAGDSVGLYKSTDAGNTWTPIVGPFNGQRMTAVAANGTLVVVAGAGSVYRSTNGGTSWTTSFTGAGIGEDLFGAIAIDPLNTNIVYAGDFHVDFGTTSSYLIVKSTDGGATFHNLTDASAADLRGYFLQVDPVTSGTLYAAGSGSPNVAKSTNNAATWTSASPVAGYPTALALAPNLIVRLYAGMKDIDNTTVLGVYRTNGGGVSWTAINTGLGSGAVNALYVDPGNADHVHAGLSDGYYVTTDGTNWSAGAAGAGSHFINAFAQTTTRRIIASTGSGIIIMLPLDPAPTISANASPGSGNPAGGDSVTISGTGFNINPASGLRVLFGGLDGLVSIPFSGSTSVSVVSTPAHAPGSVDVAVINPDGQAAIRTNGYTYVAGTIALNAVGSQSGAAQVSLTWTAAGGATSYDVRLLNIVGGTFSTVTTTSGLSYNHTGISLAAGYVYQIVANTGAYSNLDLAVPMDYTDPSLTTATTIKAAHFNELRTGVNAARSAVGLPTVTFTDTLSSTMAIKRVHLIELRSGLDDARATLGLTPVSYTDSTITAGSTMIKAQHILDLRGGLQ
jgi:hypothetical protein